MRALAADGGDGGGDTAKSHRYQLGQSARRLGVSRERVQQMLEQGTLAGIRIEGQVRARYVDLEGEGSENDQVLVSIQEAARRTGMSTSTIRRWIEAGRLEAFRLEGDRRVYIALD